MSDTRSGATVVFSHGKESGPWGSKITAMADVARGLGMAVESVDYRGIDDPSARVEKLVAATRDKGGPVVMVGSSMGGHVSAVAAPRVVPLGLFLLAPAFYMSGLETQSPHEIRCPTVIVHGWRDQVVPVEHSIRWAREQGAALHILDSGHRLEDQIAIICTLLRAFLTDLV